MSYHIDIRRSVKKKLQGWLTGALDFLLVDAHLRLEILRDNPASHLRRRRRPFDGMVFEYSLIDPKDRLCRHVFAFHIQYSQDETTLMVINVGYWLQAGM